MMRRLDSRAVSVLILTGITACGLVLRAQGLDTLQLWYDEMALWLYTASGVPPTPVEPPLMAWILSVVMWSVGSASPFVMHGVVVVLGVMAIPLAYFCASRLDDRPSTGWIAAALTAISPMAIYYSREARPYALFILLSTALYAGALWAYRKDTRRSWLVYATVLTVCGWTHMVTVQILIVLTLFAAALLLRPRLLPDVEGSALPRVLRFLAFTAAGVLVGHTWMAYRFLSSFGSAVAIGRAFAGGIYPYGVVDFFRTVFVNLGPGPVRAIFGDFTGSDALAVVFVMLFAAGLWSCYATRRRHLVVFATLLFAVPLSIYYVTLGTAGSWDWARYISHLLIPFVVVCSMGFQAVTSRLRPWQRGLAFIFLLLAVLPNAVSLPERLEYRQYRDMVAYLDEHRDSLAGVIVLPVVHNLGTADERITNIYYQQKREQLPVYELSDGTIRKVQLVPGRVADVARGVQPEAALRSGRYAVLWRRPLKDCRSMSSLVKGMTVMARETLPGTLTGMTVCELEIASAIAAATWESTPR